MSSVRVGGIVFAFYPYDHEPRHTHAFYGGIEVIVELLDDRTIALAEREDCIAPANAKRSDVKKILKAAQEHYGALVAEWEKMHR